MSLLFSIRRHPSEALFILAGLGMLLQVVLFTVGEGLTVWLAAKLLYAVGTLLFLFDK